MRALGPGSVSSFLKIILDVVSLALWVGVAAGALFTLGLIIFDFDPGLFGPQMSLKIEGQGVAPPLITVGVAGATAYTAGVLIIVERLRRVFGALTAGDPFHPENVRRLRVVALMLAALELGRYPVAAANAWLAPGRDLHARGINLTAWFAVLVVFVLAEVFREGARLRREAELTI